LRHHRPKSVAGRYAYSLAPSPEIFWSSRKLWEQHLRLANKTAACWNSPAAMANDPEHRDALICFLDELATSRQGLKAMAYGLAQALDSDASWLLRYLRLAAEYLKLKVPRGLPMYLARHGSLKDRALLVASLAEGGERRVHGAATLISFGLAEYEEVLLEVRRAPAREALPSEVWLAADALVAGT